MTDTYPDLDFLIQAANYPAGNTGAFSAEARKAVDVVAQRLRVAAERELEQLKNRTNRPEGQSAR